MQYRVSVSISSDICTLVTRLLSNSFNHSIIIANMKHGDSNSDALICFDTIVQKLTSDNEFFGENFRLLGGRENYFYSADGPQFVATGPAKNLKIGQKLSFYGQNEF